MGLQETRSPVDGKWSTYYHFSSCPLSNIIRAGLAHKYSLGYMVTMHMQKLKMH